MEFITRSESPLADFLRHLAPQILVLSPAMLILRNIDLAQWTATEALKGLVLLILLALWGHMAWSNAAQYAAQTFAPLYRLFGHGRRRPVLPTDRELTGARLLWRLTRQLWRTDRRQCLHLLVTPVAIGSALAIVLVAAWNAAALVSRAP
ncbi:MAG: hypothetical protein AB8C46_00135 [Burkholderiaceae bacterium]